jgi:hypothetical protein
MEINEFDQIWETETSRQRFFSEMIPMILDKMESASLPRRFLTYRDNIQQGEIISHSKDEDVPAVILSPACSESSMLTGLLPESVSELVKRGTKVFPYEFWNTAFPKINLSEIATRQYDIVERIKNKVAYQLLLQEERQFKLLVDASIELHGNSKKFGLLRRIVGMFRRGYLLLFLYQIVANLSRKYNMKYIVCTRATLTQLRSLIYQFGSELALKELEEGGFFGMKLVMLANVPDHESVWDDALYFFPDVPVGFRDLRIPLTVLPADTFIFGKFQYGAIFGEMGGMGITKTDSIYKLTI